MTRPWMAAGWMFLFLSAHALAQGPGGPAGGGAELSDALAWQIALDAAGFSPGVIDGRAGAKTAAATKEFQTAHGLTASGSLDAATSEALAVRPQEAVAKYTVREDDLAQVGTLPKGWLQKSQLARLAYPSLDQMLAEKFHCTIALLGRLNPNKNLAGLRAGDEIVAPAVRAGTIAAGSRIDVDLSRKVVRVLDDAGRCVGRFNCSVAADKANLPSGQARVATIVNNPTYKFDPAKWPEVKGISETLLIPPGPRNPVGMCWVGLSLKGYGIHGTPAPEMIGKTGSHGCIRLANWDAVRLGQMVHVGAPVAFIK